LHKLGFTHIFISTDNEGIFARPALERNGFYRIWEVANRRHLLAMGLMPLNQDGFKMKNYMHCPPTKKSLLLRHQGSINLPYRVV
jgi:hypothetical protein